VTTELQSPGNQLVEREPDILSSPAGHKGVRLSNLHDQGSQPAPPIKLATWEWYIPIYFWAGGISAGGWLAAAAEDWAGERDRDVVRAGRYLALGGVMAGSALLIADLGRPDRFLNMLRIIKARSAMSLGSWGLALYGPLVGTGALLQAAEDGLLGDRAWLAKLSRGAVGRALHLVALPPALFVGGYTGVLLASTSTPSWGRRTAVLGPLSLASAVSSGMAAVTLILLASGRLRRRTHRRLARAEAAALAAELALAVVSHAQTRKLPSARSEPRGSRIFRALTLLGGMGAPLALGLVSQRRRRRDKRRDLLTASLALAGSLALRYVFTREGNRSARTGADTWHYTQQKHAF
jgi:formate-dependent nitrite reductase membrane component NrfD